MEKLLTISDVKALTQFSLAHIYRLIERRELRAIRVGDSLRVRPSVLEQFLLDHEAPPVGKRGRPAKVTPLPSAVAAAPRTDTLH